MPKALWAEQEEDQPRFIEWVLGELLRLDHARGLSGKAGGSLSQFRCEELRTRVRPRHERGLA